MSQDETIKIVQPFTNFLEDSGWIVEKTHGNRFQKGLPDLFLAHRNYGTRWAEAKVIRNGDLHFEISQYNKFSRWLSFNVGIWVVYGYDFRGTNGKIELKRAYDRLFEKPNCATMMNKECRKLLLRG